jgi:DNA-binding transcriptional LysR family regulator
MHDANSARAVAQLQQLDWSDLRIFLTIAEHCSVRAAALTMGLHASTISRRLASLEGTLCTKLFERHPAGLKLTTAGKEVKALCEQLDHGVRHLGRRMAGRDQRIEGVLRITTAEVIAKVCCRFVAEFQHQHPLVSIELSISDQVSNLQRHEVDVAVRVADAPPEDLVGKRVGHSRVGLFAARSYLEAHGGDPWKQGHRFVEWPSGLRHKPAFQWLDQQFPQRHVGARIYSAGAALDAVRSGMGISLLGISQALHEPELVMLEALPASCATSVWMLTHRDLKETARVRVLMDHMSAAFAAHPASL